MTHGLFDLTGKTALLTGASKGMGRAMAEALALHGAKVMISSRKLEPCQQAADAINERVGEQRAFAHACNAGYKEQLQSLVDATHAQIRSAVAKKYGLMSALLTAWSKVAGLFGSKAAEGAVAWTVEGPA